MNIIILRITFFNDYKYLYNCAFLSEAPPAYTVNIFLTHALFQRIRPRLWTYVFARNRNGRVLLRAAEGFGHWHCVLRFGHRSFLLRPFMRVLAGGIRVEGR